MKFSPKGALCLATKKKDLPTFRGKPLVRSGNVLYYGNPAESCIAMLQVLTNKEWKDITLADRCLLYTSWRCSTPSWLSLPDWSSSPSARPFRLPRTAAPILSLSRCRTSSIQCLSAGSGAVSSLSLCCLPPVSYTHLDVYKRQTLLFCICQPQFCLLKIKSTVCLFAFLKRAKGPLCSCGYKMSSKPSF